MFKIVTDSSCDLPVNLMKEKDVDVVPFYVAFGEDDYKKEIIDIDPKDFYRKMRENNDVFPKTSCPSAQDYFEVFEKYVKQNIPIICICITTKFSSSMQSAITAKNMIEEEYGECKIEIINSMVNTVLQGLFVMQACGLRDCNIDIDKAVEILKSIRESGRIFFTVGDTRYLEHGGRIGKVAGIAATVLDIKPMITLKEGEIFSSGVVRSRKKSMKKAAQLLSGYIKERNIDVKEYSLCIGYGSSEEEGKEFRQIALDTIPELKEDDLPMFQIGAAIGVHTGPYPIGFGIIKKAVC